jgi:hypothetical protein
MNNAYNQHSLKAFSLEKPGQVPRDYENENRLLSGEEVARASFHGVRVQADLGCDVFRSQLRPMEESAMIGCTCCREIIVNATAVVTSWPYVWRDGATLAEVWLLFGWRHSSLALIELGGREDSRSVFPMSSEW